MFTNMKLAKSLTAVIGLAHFAIAGNFCLSYSYKSMGGKGAQDWRTFPAGEPCDTTNYFDKDICPSLPAGGRLCDVSYNLVSAEDDTIEDAGCSIALEIDGTVYHGRLSDDEFDGSECGGKCGFPPRFFQSSYIFEDVPICD
ncbi:hypothetical protein J7T55_008476 [Diaporthe amygdali]|uniref:uncharacterized protein n=1 Tax=Phomopsis amygdali TaxID=1214568 RepID=UPI0022FE7B73|nr:uncharacterized protein J7T55_008476 [Diaporthe amygdali]KAJ0121312.1 hypothetical protein J7T55_008476 [Diaporthe amygdali]